VSANISISLADVAGFLGVPLVEVATGFPGMTTAKVREGKV
jgi:hypothetical protein